MRRLKTSPKYILWLSLMIVLLGLTACAPQEPIIIRITPTQDTTAVAQQALDTQQAATVTHTPTVAATATDTETAPTVTPITPTVILPTATETPVPSTATLVRTDGSFGPIILPNYTPPPTSTPRPTQQPSATPLQETPITTPISQSPALQSSQMGVQLYYNITIDEWWQWLRRTDPMGVDWIKVQANWDFLQPDHPDQFDSSFRLFQAHVQQAHNDGYRVLVSIAKAPDWARDGITEGDGPPADPQALAYFLDFMLERVGREISAIEIWNEPNLEREWIGGLEWSGAGYMQLFRAGYDAVRAYSNEMPVITAGLAPTNAPGTIDDRAFLRQMYAADLADPYYVNIAIGAHPYGWGNPPDARCCDNIAGRSWDDDPRFFFLNTLEIYHRIMVNNGHDNVQIWATEFGWATWDGLPQPAPDLWMTYNSQDQQAEYILRAFEIGQSLDYVGPMFLWNMNFANSTLIEQRNEMVGYSLFIPELGVRPIYDRIIERPRAE